MLVSSILDKSVLKQHIQTKQILFDNFTCQSEHPGIACHVQSKTNISGFQPNESVLNSHGL